MEVTPDNLERMKDISKTHKAFQLEFKGKTKKKKIQNGGLFLQQWKQKLDALNRRYDEKLREKTGAADKGNNGVNNTKSKEEKSSKQKASSVVANNKRKALAAAKKRNGGSSPQEILRDRSELAMRSCLTTRQSSHIQAIPLSFGLKKILVEDWENLNNSNFASTDSSSNANTNDASSDEHSNRDMVHVLPAKVTIRDALSLYLKEKGISWDGETKDLSTINTNSNGGKANCTNEAPPTETDPLSKPNEKIPDSSSSNDPSKTSIETSHSVSSPLADETMSIKQENNKMVVVRDDPDFNSKQHDNGNGDNGKCVSIQLEKEWTDMADGIVLYFEQALMARLLYPSEISQILVLEDTIIDGDDNGGVETANSKIIESMIIPLKVDIYGCEHLLRLLAAIPRILDQQLQESRKRKLQRKTQNNTRSSTTSKNNETGGAETTDEDAADDAAAAADQDSDAFVEIGSMILAKLQDLSRFLQKNQSTLFRSMYRKKNEQEIKRDIKIQKRQERRLKNAAAAASQNTLQNTSKEQMEDTTCVVDDKPQ
jgi:hypothetical protein